MAITMNMCDSRERWRTWEDVGREGRRNNGRTAWPRIVGCRASRGTGVPQHVTLELGTAAYAKEVAGL